jgi:hypothetical protein
MRDTAASDPGAPNNPRPTEKRTPKPPADDYIDFEEIKK